MVNIPDMYDKDEHKWTVHVSNITRPVYECFEVKINLLHSFHFASWLPSSFATFPLWGFPKCTKQLITRASQLKTINIYTHDFSLMLPKNPRLLKESLPLNPSGQITIFHQPRFPWNKGISLTKPPFGGNRSCEVAIIWPDPCTSNM